MKKVRALLVAAGLFIAGTSAALSPQKTILVDKAADMIVTMMEEKGISHVAFSDTIAAFQNAYEDDGEKVEILEALLHAVMDGYFQVENFLACESYYDGCNTCVVGTDLSLACTRMACIQQDTPRCEQYAGEEEMTDLNIDQIAVLCEDNGAAWDDEHLECSGLSPEMCESYGGRHETCGSACRHDGDATICTLQCVVYCDFSDVEAKILCDMEGGNWKMNGRGSYTCYSNPSDVGTPCTDSSQCEESCVVDGMEDTTTGECGSFQGGCMSSLEDGQVVTLCE